ncbi:MAG: response regulator [Longimicrobiales bacterium]|nr:response regulator [Longimicrobiales bacterium]
MTPDSRPGWAHLDPLLPASPNVLIVEDDDATARSLAKVVESFGCRVRVTNSAEGADRWLSAEEVDLVLLDVQLPRMNGVEFLHWVLRRSPTTAVVMVTGNDDIGLALECMEGGARTYLVKPVEVPVLRIAVRDALAMRTLLLTYLDRGAHG